MYIARMNAAAQLLSGDNGYQSTQIQKIGWLWVADFA
jgi:hypothetical protein